MAEALLDTYLKCPVCLDTITEPVTLGCNHSFCQSCLKDSWEKNNTRNCPVCRRKSSKDNTLINFALKELTIQFREKLRTTESTGKDQENPTHPEVSPEMEKHGVCGKHPEEIPLFCKDEGRALCPVCEFSQHQRHTVVRVEEVQKELRLELETLIHQRGRYEKLYVEITKYADKQAIQCEDHIRARFSKLHQFLKQEETRALEALREEQQRQAHTMSPELGRISETLASVERTIQELKELLNGDTETLFHMYDKIQTKAKAHSSQPNPQPSKGMLLDQAKILGNLGYRVWKKMRTEVSYSPVILDPNTAARSLCLSEDLRGVTQGDTEQHIPDNPERFINCSSVQGSEGFSSGTHQWEVEVGDHPHWEVGVVKESVERKEECALKPEDGVWRLGLYKGTYRDVFGKPFKPKGRPEKVRVHMDCDRGQLTFTDAAQMTKICSYKGTFKEKLFPIFSVARAGEAKTKGIKICLSEGPSGNVEL